MLDDFARRACPTPASRSVEPATSFFARSLPLRPLRAAAAGPPAVGEDRAHHAFGGIAVYGWRSRVHRRSSAVSYSPIRTTRSGQASIRRLRHYPSSGRRICSPGRAPELSADYEIDCVIGNVDRTTAAVSPVSSRDDVRRRRLIRAGSGCAFQVRIRCHELADSARRLRYAGRAPLEKTWLLMCSAASPLARRRGRRRRATAHHRRCAICGLLRSPASGRTSICRPIIRPAAVPPSCPEAARASAADPRTYRHGHDRAPGVISRAVRIAATRPLAMPSCIARIAILSRRLRRTTAARTPHAVCANCRALLGRLRA